MLRMMTIALAALGCVALMSSESQAQVYVRAPFVRVYSGPPVYPVERTFAMRIPLVLRLEVNRPATVVTSSSPSEWRWQDGQWQYGNQPASALEVAPMPSKLPGGEVAPLPAKVQTHDDFARAFKPLPGTHEAVVLHPITGQAVTIRFTLPEGNPRVRVLRRAIIFDYGQREVEIRFQIGGRVGVISR